MQKMSSLETQKHDCLCAIRNSKSNRYELSFISRSLVPCGFRGFFTVRDWRNPTIFRLLCSWFRSSSVSCTTTRESTNFKILSVTFHSLLINDEWQLRLLPTSNLNEGMELQRPFLHLSLSLSFFLSFNRPQTSHDLGAISVVGPSGSCSQSHHRSQSEWRQLISEATQSFNSPQPRRSPHLLVLWLHMSYPIDLSRRRVFAPLLADFWIKGKCGELILGLTMVVWFPLLPSTI